MNLDEAVAAAERELRAMENPDLPLRLDSRELWQERSWCYVFPFNSVAFLDRDEILQVIPTGPLIVPKNGSEPWVSPSAFPVKQVLDEYERDHGISG